MGFPYRSHNSRDPSSLTFQIIPPVHLTGGLLPMQVCRLAAYLPVQEEQVFHQPSSCPGGHLWLNAARLCMQAELRCFLANAHA